MIRIMILPLMFYSHFVVSDTFTSKDDAKAFTEKVVKMVASRDLESGLRLMAPYVIIPEAEFETSIKSAKFKRHAMIQRFGNPIATEFICENVIAESYYYIIQTVKYERHSALFNASSSGNAPSSSSEQPQWQEHYDALRLQGKGPFAK